jgi:N-acetylglucosaminyl-diphospho-decaprenol L-rhamnosyltransferase
MSQSFQHGTKGVPPQFSFSIVSHGQGRLVRHLLEDLGRFKELTFEVIITLNIPEEESFLEVAADLPTMVLRNASPLGFGGNHNQAFKHSKGTIFVVLNPDLRIPSFDFTTLLSSLADQSIGAWAPQVLSPAGAIEDSARRFPTLPRLLKRVMKEHKVLDYTNLCSPTEVDWVAGMFVAFRRDAYQRVNGFDEKFFMYLEDADICVRLKLKGLRIILDPRCHVIHDAQRASHRQLNHLYWHLTSLAKFLLLPPRA